MPRKLTRRERLERQGSRGDRGDVPAPQAAPKLDGEEGLSYTGALGGLLGAGIFFFLAGAIFIEEEGGRRLWALVFSAGGAFFIPAIIVSLVPGHPRRQSVLRYATIGTMLMAGLGLLTFGIGVAVVLSPITALLAIGAGLIFQGSPAKK